jgi:Holliday junction resolvase RusA-like endonuclease
MKSIAVTGVPQPQGSKRVVRGRLIDVNQRKLRDWRAIVSQAVNDVEPLSGEIAVRLYFYLPRPKGHFGSGKNKDKLKDSSPSRPGVKPDLDKLVRACLDSMTGLCFRDDSQVVTIEACKFYADGGRRPGVSITLEPV